MIMSSIRTCSNAEDTFIPFIAGYTSWGYPYEILEAEEEDIEADSDELPF